MAAGGGGAAAAPGACGVAHDAAGDAYAGGQGGEACETAAAAPAAVAASGPARAGQRRRWADDPVPWDADDAGSDDDCMDADLDDGGWEDDGADEQEGHGADALEPSPQELKDAWLQECQVVKQMLRQGCPTSSAALAAACTARDEAEARWRRAKKPQPIAIRMGWAQRNVDRAERALTRHRVELEEFERQYEDRRAEIRERLDAADERYRRRVEELDALHAEAGELAAGATGGAAKGSGEGGGGDSEIRDLVAKELLVIVEALEEGTEARGRANLLLAQLATPARQAAPTQVHYIGDDGVHEHGRAATEGGGKACGTRNCGGGKGPASRSGEAARWRTDVHGRWSHRESMGVDSRGGAGAVSKVLGQGSRSTAARAGQAPGVHEGQDAHAAPSNAARAPRPRDEIGADDSEGPQGKSHRGDDLPPTAGTVGEGGDDLARARRLHEEQLLAMEAARRANAEFGDDQSKQIVGQLYARSVEQFVARARRVGLRATADGKPLIELAPQDLTAWVKDHLEPAEATFEKEASEL